ncbi:hypothetical protein NMY22_g2999 [Coprinellus aureogranulatus]|nr:hypothetical protein NMY22_g2999 [Coprinellus aureogranulatus]
MGRLRMKKSGEEAKAYNNAKSQEHYNRNKDAINAARRLKYAEKKKTQPPPPQKEKQPPSKWDRERIRVDKANANARYYRKNKRRIMERRRDAEVKRAALSREVSPPRDSMTSRLAGYRREIESIRVELQRELKNHTVSGFSSAITEACIAASSAEPAAIAVKAICRLMTKFEDLETRMSKDLGAGLPMGHLQSLRSHLRTACIVLDNIQCEGLRSMEGLEKAICRPYLMWKYRMPSHHIHAVFLMDIGFWSSGGLSYYRSTCSPVNLSYPSLLFLPLPQPNQKGIEMPPRKRYPNPHTFSVEEIKVLHDAHKQWRERPGMDYKKDLKETVTKVIDAYNQRKHPDTQPDELPPVDPAKRAKIAYFVRDWVLSNFKVRTKAQRFAAKNYSGRRVYYYKHKKKVTKRAKAIKDATRLNDAGATQKAISEFYQALSEEQKVEFEVIAKQWSLDGPPQEIQIESAEKCLATRMFALFQDCYKHYSKAIFVVHWAYETSDGFKWGLAEFNKQILGKSFLSTFRKQYDKSGMSDIWQDFAEGAYEQASSHPLTKMGVKGGKSPLMHLDTTAAFGEPILKDPNSNEGHGVCPRDWLRDMYLAFLTMHWNLALPPETRGGARIAWTGILKNIRDYVAPEHLPEDLVTLFKKSDEVPKDDLLKLLRFWWDRQTRGEDIVFEFTHTCKTNGSKRQERAARAKPIDGGPRPQRDSAEDDAEDSEAGSQAAGDDGDGGQDAGDGSRKKARKRVKGKLVTPSNSDEEDDEDSDEDEDKDGEDSDSDEEDEYLMDVENPINGEDAWEDVEEEHLLLPAQGQVQQGEKGPEEGDEERGCEKAKETPTASKRKRVEQEQTPAASIAGKVAAKPRKKAKQAPVQDSDNLSNSEEETTPERSKDKPDRGSHSNARKRKHDDVSGEEKGGDEGERSNVRHRRSAARKRSIIPDNSDEEALDDLDADVSVGTNADGVLRTGPPKKKSKGGANLGTEGPNAPPTGSGTNTNRKGRLMQQVPPQTSGRTPSDNAAALSPNNSSLPPSVPPTLPSNGVGASNKVLPRATKKAVKFPENDLTDEDTDDGLENDLFNKRKQKERANQKAKAVASPKQGGPAARRDPKAKAHRELPKGKTLAERSKEMEELHLNTVEEDVQVEGGRPRRRQNTVDYSRLHRKEALLEEAGEREIKAKAGKLKAGTGPQANTSKAKAGPSEGPAKSAKGKGGTKGKPSKGTSL